METSQKMTKTRRPHHYMKTAVLIAFILMLGGTGTYAATHYDKLQNALMEQKRLQHTLTGKKAEITVQTAEPQPTQDTSLYDVKLSYIPEGYTQDETDHYLYQEKNGDGCFSVILYHLQTEYHTVRSAGQVKEFSTPNGQGYYGGRKYHYFAMLTLTDTDYMIQIDGYDMPGKEVQKIAENVSLLSVEKASDIQAHTIEWTQEKQQEADAFRQKMEE